MITQIEETEYEARYNIMVKWFIGLESGTTLPMIIAHLDVSELFWGKINGKRYSSAY